jgi:hypothetical protein
MLCGTRKPATSGEGSKKGHVRHEVQDLHGSCVEGRAAIFDQERQDRPHGDAQRCGSEEAQEKQPVIQETVTAFDEEMIREEFCER